ncbi:MAG: hypothetical protein L6W00_11230 [Lentisphaeria bacterium]|nr:MAG: hypothetical protein L6W00_11230 [Lentisphaeria bacterium]
MSTIPAKEYLNSLGMFGIKPGLEATQELMCRAGDPCRDLRFLHLAGTNGKGSTGAMLECALRSAGFTTGFYSSPHLVDIRERFRVNGRAVSPEDFDAFAAELAEAARRTTGRDFRFTYFEFTTVLAAMIFARAGVDFVVWETGMGGRLDSTNVVTPVASIITNIALDHQAWLGDSIEKIAREKAGIIKPAVPLFYGEMPEKARRVLLDRARSLGAAPAGPGEEIAGPIRFTRENGLLRQEFEYAGRTIRLPLLGGMQRKNFRLVHRVLEFLAARYGLDLDRALDGLANVRWPARCQQLNERLFVDGGHNPDGLSALREAMEEIAPGEKIHGDLRRIPRQGCGNEPQADRAAGGGVSLCPAARGGPSLPHPGRAVRNGAKTECSGLGRANALLAVNDALADSPRKVLVAGSLYLAGEVLADLADRHLVLDLA